jgi:hypothetical protein
MSIYRIHKDKENPFVIINKEALNDTNLSWKAKGLLAYLLSLPDDWQIYESEIVKHAKDGIDSTRTAIKELIDAGYIERQRVRDEKGRLKGYEYNVYEAPIHIGFSKDGFSKVGESNTTNNNYTNNDNTNIYNGSFQDQERPSLVVDNFCKYKSLARGSPLEDYEPHDSEIELIKYFFKRYKEVFHRPHPAITNQQLQEAYQAILSNDHMFGAEGYEIIDQYFKTAYPNKKVDYHLMHFVSGRIIEILSYGIA